MFSAMCLIIYHLLVGSQKKWQYPREVELNSQSDLKKQQSWESLTSDLKHTTKLY